jgi:uncharacterized protein (TIGR03435 family)
LILPQVFVKTGKAAGFETASIKPAPSDARGGGYSFGPGGRTTIHNFTLKNLIMVAPAGLRGGWVPAWGDSERYEVEARTEGDPSEEDARLMLRSLLGDRFHLQLRRETRELPVYSLGVVKPGGLMGSGLVRAKSGTCVPAEDLTAPAAQTEPGQPSCGLKRRHGPRSVRS